MFSEARFLIDTRAMDGLIVQLQGHRDKLRKINENASQLNAVVKTFSDIVIEKEVKNGN